MDMEANQSSRRSQCALPVVTNMLNHRGEAGFNFGENLDYLIQALLDCVNARGRRFAGSVRWFNWRWQLTASEHCVKVLRLPAKCYRQRFQGSRTSAALNGVTLDFPHGRGHGRSKIMM
jgi:hypothetical protein